LFIEDKQKEISAFLEKPDSAKIRTFLDKICPISGQCITFGIDSNKMRRYFNNYDFSLADRANIKKIGSSSANGFILEIPFVKDNYKSYTVLKNAINSNSDNLFYEALVGLYINKKNFVYPCFLETYGFYYWKDADQHTVAWQFSKGQRSNKDIDLTKLARLEKNFSYKSFFNDKKFINQTCQFSKYGSVLIQHIHNARTLHNYLDDYRKNMEFFTFHLPQYLYQVYAPLGMLADEYTHYDLHTGNVILYTVGSELPTGSQKTSVATEGVPNNGQYITMKYHYPDGDVVSFNTFDIAKILDYGRCYFKENEEYNSSTYYQVLRESIQSAAKDDNDIPKNDVRRRGKCHNNSYDILEPENPPGSFHYISSSKRNKSHDLRLAATIWHTPGKYNSNTNRNKMNNDIDHLRSILVAMFYEDTYLVELSKADKQQGTPEDVGQNYVELKTLKASNPNATIKLDPARSIKNVADMHLALKDLILHTKHFKALNDTIFTNKTKIGEMNIWLDGSRSLQYTTQG